MAILVDRAIWRWRGRRFAHLASDGDLEELHAFAARLGLRREWFQGDHYDVPEDVRRRALALGAHEIDSRELVRRLRQAGLRRPRPDRRAAGADAAARGRRQAARLAGELAARAGAELVDLDDLQGAQAAADLANTVWGRAAGDDLVGAPLLRALAHAGNHLQGARIDGRLAAMVLGFLGRSSAGVHLHSHLLAVAEDRRGQGLGLALKQSQRAWALQRGITRVTWTFDPLVVRNAELNLRRLGAVAGEYLPDHYGRMRDAFNAGDATDRLLVRWQLDSPRASWAADGARAGAVAPPHGAAVLLDADGDHPGERRPSALQADDVWVAAPPDVGRLRADDPRAAAAWRQAVGEALTSTLTAGFVAVDATRHGWYQLRRSERP